MGYEPFSSSQTRVQMSSCQRLWPSGSVFGYGNLSTCHGQFEVPETVKNASPYPSTSWISSRLVFIANLSLAVL
jgi:hypothetical protein